MKPRVVEKISDWFNEHPKATMCIFVFILGLIVGLIA